MSRRKLDLEVGKVGITGILSARHLHYISTPTGPRPVKTAEEYRFAQQQYIRYQQRMGMPIGIPSPQPPIKARISGGNWLVDCPCGNAPLTDPEWKVAYCFSCNRHFLEILFPPTLRAIEAELLKRPNPATRHWFPHESVADLKRENKEHGVE